jgi:hypothetical protein
LVTDVEQLKAGKIEYQNYFGFSAQTGRGKITLLRFS